MNAFIERLGWMLLHSLWEGAAIWLLLQVILIALRKKSAQARYLAACFALAAMALLPWMTFSSMDLSARLRSVPIGSVPALVHSEDAPSPSAVALSSDVASSPRAAGSLETFVLTVPRTSFVNAFLPWLVGGWGLGVAIFAFRLWISWRTVRRLARIPLSELSAAWQRRLGELCRTAGVRSIVRAGETAAVVVPLVVGWLKPVILLPLGVLAQLPAEQVEAILFHELAHIRRHDFLINLLQSVVETLFFYHPAVRSISRRIREERELVCDDLSVEWCRNPVVYAEALTTFEEFRRQSLALAVTGEGDLLTRVRRIVLGIEPRQRTASFIAVAGFLATGVYLASMFLAPLLAAELMTDKERVAAIQALQPPPGPGANIVPGQEIIVEGTITTEDGQPLPESMFQRKGFFKGSSLQLIMAGEGWAGTAPIWMEGLPPHVFHANGRTGKLQFGCWAEGYAPFQQTFFQTKDSKPNFVLKRGFPASVQVIGSDSLPLKGVVLTASFPRPNQPLNVSMPPVQTDVNGFASFGNVEANAEIHLVASKPGWQMAEQVVSQWSEKTPLVWKLEAAKSTSGVVIDQVTRKPIAGAEIILAARRAEVDSQYQVFAPENGQVLGHTDSSGRFNLENLSKNYDWRIYVQATGFPVGVFPIEYGDHDRICEMPPGLHIRGKILDPKGILTAKKVYHPAVIQAIYTIQATPNSGIGKNKELTLTKLGAEIPFSFDNLPAGGVGIIVTVYYEGGLKEYRIDFNLEKNIDNYVFDLANRPTEQFFNEPDPRPSRAVEITLKTPDGTGPTGSLVSSYGTTMDRGEVCTSFTPKVLPITAGKATADFPVPTKLELNPALLIGYWFAPESFDVPAGTGAFTHTVNVLPAGVIHGHITLPARLKEEHPSAAVILIKPPAGVSEGALYGGTDVKLSANNDFVTTPLPLGGTYAVLLNAAPSYFMSAPVSLDAQHPLVAQDIDATAAPDPLTGKFVDEANKPIAHQEVMLTYHPTEHQSASFYAATTDGDGAFTISNMNFAVPGNYEVQLFGKDWQSSDWEKSKIRIDGHTPLPVIISVHHQAK
jgi:beta-lactamase regulating signal transducer with metallopeptidase domain